MSETNPILRPLAHLQSGARLGKYVILNEIGRGGMAVVYKAHQPDLDRVVAVKVLFGAALQQRFIDRFQGEARALAKMNHPNVIRIFEVGEQGGAFFLVMEFIQGMDLLAYLHEKKPSFDEVLNIVVQIAEALAYCHQQGILHRDLKPNNILMHGQIPVLIDFGLAKAVDPEFEVTLTLSGEVVGSPAYMSPEQAQGQAVGVLSDLCSLGIIMYELVSFKNPYLDQRSLHQTALNSIQAEPVPLRYLSPWLDSDFAAIVAKTMAKDPADRYPNMELLLQDLHAFRQGQPIMAKPPGFFKVAWRFVKNNPVLYIGVAFVLAMGAVAAGFLFLQKKNQEAPFGLVLEESFANPDSVTPFASLDFNGKTWVPSKSWKVNDGHLEGSCMGLCGAVTDQEFFGDIKVEYTIQGLNGTDGDFNAFLFGPTPEESFRFTLGEWGSGRANIEFGARVRTPRGGAPVRLNSGVVYKVTLEKEGHSLRLFLDDHLLVEKFYPLPVKIERNSKIGFYTWNGSVAVDDIRIYKKAVALAASPTVVADAYQEEGLISHSIPAYLHVIEAYPDMPVSYEAHLKLGKSYMVMHDLKPAMQHLILAAGGSQDPQIIPEALFQLAQCLFESGHTAEGFARLKLLHATYPESEFNRAVVQNRVEAVYNCLDRAAQPEACLPAFGEEFHFLIENEDLFRAQFGRYHADLLELFRRLGVFAVLQNAPSLLDYYAGIEEARASIRNTLVRHDIGLGDTANARRLLDQVKTSSSNLPAVSAEQEILQGVLQLLQGNSAAAGTFAQAGKEFSDEPGIPFRCFVWTRVAQELSDQTASPVEDAFFENGAVSRRERLFLAYLAGRTSAATLKQVLSTAPASLPNLEETLVEYLKRKAADARGAADYIQSALRQFPPKTYEAACLEFLLSHPDSKTVFTP